jgi:hypothetical protein
MKAPMSLLRDVNLRWSGDSLAPDWFWKRGTVEYVFVKLLRSSKLKVPGVAKVNIYCEDVGENYDGNCIDEVANVKVSTNLEELSHLSAIDLNVRFASLMVQGVNSVLAWFHLDELHIEKTVNELVEAASAFSSNLGRRLELPGSRYGIRARVRPLPDFSACVVTLAAYQGHKLVLEQPVCTTFPFPETAIEAFESLEAEGSSACVIRFRTGGATGRRLFGRHNFDHVGMSRVERLDTSVPQAPYFVIEPTFRVGLPS